ncbi:hypothetical protein ACJIZ3_007627 [Penstemon smallii]|uniref:VQ domain-containing protein n=1 Tax=Penstemon smallii TaxID=265156 RepID=A0ABD3T8H2_9LAMI
MKPYSCATTTLVPSNKLVTIHEKSHAIFKLKPKIRIIHIVEPEIIKTDVQNFREIVQRLTGKRVERKGSTKKANHVSSDQALLQKTTKKNIESPGVHVLQTIHKMKEETSEEAYWGDTTSNTFLSFMGDLDGFFNDMNEYPLYSSRSCNINTFVRQSSCSFW